VEQPTMPPPTMTILEDAGRPFIGTLPLEEFGGR
jgi:hypothetical protein